MSTTIKHYFKRIFTMPINLLIFILLPVGISLVNNMIMVIEPVIQEDVGNLAGITATIISVVIIVMFAFFGSALVYDLLFDDFKSPRRWRLLAAPTSLGKYVMANIIICTVFSLITSALIFVANVFIFDAFVPNLLVMGAALFLFTVFAQLLGMFIFLIAPKKGVAEAIVQGIVWSTSLLAGNMMGGINLGRFGNFIFQRATPNAIAMQAMFDNIFGDTRAAMTQIGYLGIYVVVMAIVVAITARRRSI